MLANLPGILLAVAAVVGFLGLAIGGQTTRPALIVAAALAIVVLILDLVAVHG